MIFGQNVDGLVVMDAAQGALSAGDAFYWQEQSDGSLKPTGAAWDKTLAGSVTFQFEIDSSGTFDVFARLDTSGYAGKVWVEIDGQQNALGPRNNGRLYYNTSGYSWQNGYDNATIALSAGIHDITFRSYTSSFKLDRVAIVPDGSTVIENNDTFEGPAHTGTGDAVVNAPAETFADWLENPIYDGYRVFLAELEHGTGTVYLSDKGWLSDDNKSYDDFIMSDPLMEFSLEDLSSVGDLYASNPDHSIDWLNYSWRGYECKWYYGDVRWPKSRFRMISRSTIEACEVVGDRLYKFDLASVVEKFSRTFYSGADVTKDQTVQTAIDWIAEQWPEGGAVTYINFTEAELDIPVLYDVTESSNMYTEMQAVAKCANAYMRISQTGDLECIKPDVGGEPSIVLGSDVIVRGSVNVVDKIPAVKRVRVEYNNGNDAVDAPTAALTGNLDEEALIVTKIKNTADANNYLANQVKLYANERLIWQMKVYGLADIIQDGAFIEIDHPMIRGAGYVRSITRSPLTKLSTLEVVI